MMADIRFRLLGPVEVTVGARQLSVSRPRQRAILAYLLLHANQAVSTDQLVDALWGRAGPTTARTQVQNDVSIVRRILRSGGANPVATRPGGYLIQVGAGQLDAAEFTTAVARAIRGAAANRGAAATELRSALSLWRGRAIADVSAAYAASFREGLEEQRCRAYEQLFALELAGGRHSNVIAELLALVQTYPLHERFAAQLMLALYRNGRPAEALRVARELRRRLADQHGLDPGPELSELELRILRNDGSLRSPEAPAGSAAAPRPSQLPPDVADFVGRDEQLATLDSLRPAGRPTIGAIFGIAGVGKTALALHWAHRVADHFPDGQLYVDMRGYSADLPLPPVDVLGRFLRALGVDAAQVPADLDEATAAYRTVLAGRRVLVVVDNAYGVDQVRPLLPTAAGCAGLVTSRHRLDGLVALDAARPMTLDLLPPDAALDLLSRILGGSRLAAERAAAVDLTDACGYLPLALRIAAAQLAVDPEQTIASLLSRLQPGERLAALSIAGDSRASVAAAFALSYSRLEPASRRAFGLLGVAPGADFSVLTAAALLDTAADGTREALRELEVASLVDRHADRFLMHDLVREYAATTLPPDEAAAGIERYLAYLLRSASAATTLVSTPPVRLSLPPDDAGPRPDFTDASAALDWLDAERANLVGAIRFAAGGHQASAWLLADVLRGYFRRGMYIGDWIGSAEAALRAVALADPAVRPQVEAISHLSLGLAFQATGRHPAAVEHFTTAQALAARADWRDVEASALGNLGVMTWRAGDLAGASALLEAAVGLAPGPRHSGVVSCFVMIG
jgi:DNA-binding SARP family transcriptional activator